MSDKQYWRIKMVNDGSHEFLLFMGEHKWWSETTTWRLIAATGSFEALLAAKRLLMDKP